MEGGSSSMKHQPYTNTQIDRIVRLRMHGFHPCEIATMEERSITAINRLLSIEKRLRNLIYPAIKRYNTKWTEERIEQMAREYPRKSYAALGRERGLSAPRVYFLFAKRAHGLQVGTWRG